MTNSAWWYTGSNSKPVWITYTVWTFKKPDSVVNWEEILVNCIHVWLAVTHNSFFNLPKKTTCKQPLTEARDAEGERKEEKIL